MTSPLSHLNGKQDYQHGSQQNSGPGHRRDGDVGGLGWAGTDAADIEPDDWAHAPRALSTVYTWLVLGCLGLLAGALFCLGYALDHSAHDSAHDSAGPPVSYPVAAFGEAATHESIHTTTHRATGASGGPVAATTRAVPSRAVVATVRLLAQHTPLVDPSTPASGSAPIGASARPAAPVAAPVAALTPTPSAVGVPALNAVRLKTVRLKTVRLKTVRLKTVRLKTVQRPRGCKTGWMDDLMRTGQHNDYDNDRATRLRRHGVIKAGPIEIALGADLAAGQGCDQNRNQNRDQRRADDRDCPCRPYGPGYRGDPSNYSYPRGYYYPGSYYPDHRGGYPSDYADPRYPGGYRDGYPGGYSGGVCRTVGPRVRPELPDGGLVCTRSDPHRGW